MNTFQILDELLKEHHLSHSGTIKWFSNYPDCSHTDIKVAMVCWGLFSPELICLF